MQSQPNELLKKTSKRKTLVSMDNNSLICEMDEQFVEDVKKKSLTRTVQVTEMMVIKDI